MKPPFGLTPANAAAFRAELNALPATGPAPGDVDAKGASPMVAAAVEDVRAIVASIEEAKGREILTTLPRGTVLRNARHGHTEVGIVLGPSPTFPDAVEVLHGWLDNPPDCGAWDQRVDQLSPKAWRIATLEESEIVRALFLAHAREWGTDSKAWVALKGTEDPKP